MNAITLMYKYKLFKNLLFNYLRRFVLYCQELKDKFKKFVKISREFYKLESNY